VATRVLVVRAGDPIAADPAVPLPPPPREARLRTKIRVGAAVIATLVAAAAVVLLLLAMQHGRALERMRDGGVVTTGRVVDRHYQSSGRSKTRTLTYNFDHDGTSVRDSESVSTSTFDRFPIGAPIPVTYERADPSNHQLFEVGEREVSEFWTATSIGGGAFGAIAIVAAAVAFTVYRRRLALLRDGQVVTATIVKVGRFFRKNRSRKVAFTFTAPTGEVITKRHWIPKSAIVPGQEGLTAAYLVDPSDGKRGEPVVVVLGSCEVV
jgi:hypothetical protein